MSKSVIGIIPARSGSKRLPRKNLKELGGKPLLAHTIDQAKSAEILDDVLVSTDSDEIKRVARKFGGWVPFDRPKELATDKATNNQVVKHALNWLAARDRNYEIVCMLQVTSPFRTAHDIDEAINSLMYSKASSLVSTTEFQTPPFWAVKAIDNGEYLRPYFGDEYLWSKTQSQSVPTLHHPNGAIFAAEVQAFNESVSFYTDRTIEHRMPRSRSIDIDEPFDLEIARALFKSEAKK